MSEGSWSPNNKMFEYRLIIHKLSVPKCFISHTQNREYSFVWKESDSYSVSTEQYTFDKESNAIDFNKTKLKLRLNEFGAKLGNIYNKTKLVLCEREYNDCNINFVDEIALSTDYFLTNKKQLTNITFNKLLSKGDIRIELRLNVTLIAKDIKYENDIYESSNDMYDKRRRSGLCANSVSTFYEKSKEIQEKKCKENKQMKNDCSALNNQLLVSVEETKQLKSQIEALQNLLFEKNTEIEQLKQASSQNNEKMKQLTRENRTLNDNKILMQAMKYELQRIQTKYNTHLNVMKSNEKHKVQKYIAQLVIDNNDLEFELNRIADSWRDTSHLMENYTNKKIRKYQKLKVLYKNLKNVNRELTKKLMNHGIIECNDTESTDIEDEDKEEQDMNVLWNENEFI